MKAVGTLRMTPSRRAILESLEAVREHPTAEEIWSLVRERLPRTSLATIYRNLERLAQSGAIRVIEDGRNQRHYDAVAAPHYHVQCDEVRGRARRGRRERGVRWASRAVGLSRIS